MQQFLPRATPQEVQDKVGYTSELLGSMGGYILSGSHHLQADVSSRMFSPCMRGHHESYARGRGPGPQWSAAFKEG